MRFQHTLSRLFWPLLACVILLCAPDGLFAQTVAVSSALTDGSASPVGGKTYMHFTLQNCGANIPVSNAGTAILTVQNGFIYNTLVTATVTSSAGFSVGQSVTVASTGVLQYNGTFILTSVSTGALGWTDSALSESYGTATSGVVTGVGGSVIVKRSFDIVANSAGLASGTVVPNDLITCGNVVSTQWSVSVMASENSPITEAQTYFICSAAATVGFTCAQPTAGAIFNLGNAQPASVSPPAPGFIPFFDNPVQSQTVNQPVNTQANFLGTYKFEDGLFSGSISFASLAGFTGLANFVYVYDATYGSSPCAGGGTGAFAFYVNGVWTCNSGSSSGSMTWPSGGAGIPNYTGSSAYGTTYNAGNTIPANFVSTLNQNTTGNAATATALATTPSLCSTGYAPTGVLPSGNATGCAALSSGSGLPSVVVYVPAGSISSAIQTILTNAVSGEEIWFSGSNTGCSLTLTVTGVRIRGLNEYSTSIQCATAGVPVLSVSGSGLNGFEISGITLRHITSVPTCSGGVGSSSCGDGLQIAGGAGRVKIGPNVHGNFNYTGLALGYTTYAEVINSEWEFNQGDGINFVMDPSNPVMQWELRGGYSGQNGANGVNMTCPGSFTSVQTTGPTFTGNFTAYGNVGYGFKFSCSGATTSGIADVVLKGVSSSTNNASGIYLDLGPNGGRNATVECYLCELTGSFTGTAAFAQTTQTATNVGYGIEVTSACDATTPPNLVSSLVWQNSYSGVSTSCPGTQISNVSAFDNGLATASAQTEAGITINAANVQVVGGYFRKGTTQTYGIYQLSGDTPSIVGPVCDSSITSSNCVFAGTAPASGYQQRIGQVTLTTSGGNLVLPNGTTATTQSTGDNSTKVATDAFVLANAPVVQGTAAPAYLGDWENTTYWEDPRGTGYFNSASTSNQVEVFMFRLDRPFSFNTLTIRTGAVGSPNPTASVGIYSSSGNRLVHWDSIVLGGVPTFQATPTGGAVLLQPGYYYWAFSNSTTVNQETAGGLEHGGSGENVEAWNIDTVRGGTAANAMVSGVLPATLGALTAGFNNAGDLPLWIVEP